MFDAQASEVLLWLVPLLAVAGVGAGVLAGLLGVGGGIVVVPVLYYVFGLLGIEPGVRMHAAVGTSLATIVPTSIRAARAHARRGAFDPGTFRAWAPAVFMGSMLGAWLATRADFTLLTSVFAVVGLLVAAQMFVGSPTWRLAHQVPRGLVGAMIPGVIGGVSAMIGIGGGTLSVPALTLCGTPIHRAVGTSSGFGVVISVPAAIGFAIGGWNAAGLPPFSLGYVNLLALALIVPTTLIAVPWGAHLAHTLSQVLLRRVFGLFLALVAGRMLFDTLTAIR